MKKVFVEISGDKLTIRDEEKDKILATHKLVQGTEEFIQDENHLRDRTNGIDAYIDTITYYFSNSKQAQYYLEAIRKIYPRYVRDQLQMILKVLKVGKQELIDLALEECIKRQRQNKSNNNLEK